MEPVFNFDNEMIVRGRGGNLHLYKYFLYEDIVVMSAPEFTSSSAMVRFKFLDASIIDGEQLEEKPFIVLHDIKMDKDLLLSTFYHELGHIKLNHLVEYEPIGREESIARGEVHYAELEADKYSFDKMGKVNTIRWLESLIERTTQNIAAREKELEQGSSTDSTSLEKYKNFLWELEQRVQVVRSLN